MADESSQRINLVKQCQTGVEIVQNNEYRRDKNCKRGSDNDTETKLDLLRIQKKDHYEK